MYILYIHIPPTTTTTTTTSKLRCHDPGWQMRRNISRQKHNKSNKECATASRQGFAGSVDSDSTTPQPCCESAWHSRLPRELPRSDCVERELNTIATTTIDHVPTHSYKSEYSNDHFLSLRLQLPRLQLGRLSLRSIESTTKAKATKYYD